MRVRRGKRGKLEHSGAVDGKAPSPELGLGIRLRRERAALNSLCRMPRGRARHRKLVYNIRIYT